MISRKISIASPLVEKALKLDPINPHCHLVFVCQQFIESRFRFAIIRSRSGRLEFGHIYAKSFYMLVKIHEEQGNIASAIEYYEKFLPPLEKRRSQPPKS